MNLAELIAAVVLETNRPDMGAVTDGGTGQITQSILASTLKMHGLDYFYKDIVPATVLFNTADYVQTLDTSTLPNFRALSYFRKVDTSFTLTTPPSVFFGSEANLNLQPQNNLPGLGIGIGQDRALGFMEILTPDNIIDGYGYEKLDVAYQAGATLFFKSSTALTKGVMGYYAWPVITLYAYSSWIANEYPYAIIYDAASAIFTATGKQEVARKYDSSDPRNPGLVMAQIMMLRQNNIVAKGY